MVGWARIATAAALVAAAGPVAADDLELSFEAGRVTVVAADVPLVTILEEWTRLGDTRFVAAHGLPARPVSVRMVDVPEREALRVLLRAAGGYIAESRSTRQPGVSAFERVLIMAGGRRPARSRPGADQFQAPAPRTTQPPGMPGGPAAAAAPGAGVEPDDDEEQDEELDDLELLESLRRRYESAQESAAEPAGDARPTFFPLPAPGAPTVRGPLTTPQPGVIMQPEDPAPQPRRPSNRPRRRTGAP
jgi:hypothetical protein